MSWGPGIWIPPSEMTSQRLSAFVFLRDSHLFLPSPNPFVCGTLDVVCRADGGPVPRPRDRRKKGVFGRVVGAVGTAVSVSVITVGAAFAAAALNAGLDDMEAQQKKQGGGKKDGKVRWFVLETCWLEGGNEGGGKGLGGNLNC